MADFSSSIKGLSKLLGGAKGELQSIETLLEKIDTVGSKALGRMKGVVSSFGQMQLGRGTTMGLGTDGASIPTAGTEGNKLQGALATSAAQQANASVPRMPTMPTMTKGQAYGTAALGAGSVLAAFPAGMYAAAPDLGTVTSTAAGFYGAAITTGVNRSTLERSTMNAMNGSFGRGVTSPTDMAAAAAQLTQGYNYSAGSNAYLQTMSEVGGAARYLNMNNATAAQAIGGFQTGSMGANLYQYGIAQFDAKGNPRSQGAIATDLYKYFFGNQKLSAAQVSANLQYGTAGASLQNMGFSSDQQQILAQQFKMIASGQNPDLASQSGSANPAAASQQITASQTDLQLRAEQPMLDGFAKAATVVTNLNKAMSGLPNSFFQLKGELQGIAGSNIGSGIASFSAALTAGIKSILDAVVALRAISLLSGTGGSALGGMLGVEGGVTGATAAAAGMGLGATAGVAGLGGTLAGRQVSQTNTKVLNSVGVHSQTASKLTGIGLGATAGAGIGLGIGSALAPFTFGASAPIGAAIGAVAGGIAGFFNGGASSGFGASFGPHGGGSSTGTTSLPTSPVPGVSPSYGYGAKDASGIWNTSSSNSHTGLDYPVPEGTNIIAVRAGTVIDEGLGKDYGIYVQIQQEDGYQSIYAHLSAKSVQVGDTVAAGQSIGKSGSTGNVSGPHLHYEVRKGKNNPVDPKTYLGSNNSIGIVSGSTAVVSGTILGTGSEQDWAKTFLQKLGKPVTTANVQAMTTWMAYEGGQWHNTAHYNPLNTTQPAAGATNMNSVGVKSYKSWDQGFQATIDTINNGRYGNILAALSKGNDTAGVLKAVNHSPWGTHITGAGGGASGYGASMPSTNAGSTINHFNMPITIQNASDEEAVRLANKIQSIIENKQAITMSGSR